MNEHGWRERGGSASCRDSARSVATKATRWRAVSRPEAPRVNLRSSEWPAEIGKDPESNHVNAQQGLHPRDGASPAGGLEVVFAPGEKAQPAAEIDVTKADIKCRHQAEKHGRAEQTPLPPKPQEQKFPPFRPSANRPRANSDAPGVWPSYPRVCGDKVDAGPVCGWQVYKNRIDERADQPKPAKDSEWPAG